MKEVPERFISIAFNELFTTPLVVINDLTPAQSMRPNIL